MKLVCRASQLTKGNASSLCVRLYVNNTKLTPSGSQVPLFFIRSICQTKTVSLRDFTEPILKAKKAHFGLLSLGRAPVTEEERKAKEKASSCVHLFVELELAFVLEGRYFYYMVITGYILSEGILLALLQANHVWGTEVHQMQLNGKVGQKLNLSQSPGARFQQAHSQIKGEKNPCRVIQHQNTNCSSWSLQAPACRKSMAGTYCYRQVLFLKLSLSHWATDLNRKQVAETDGPWSGFIWPSLGYFYVRVFSKSVHTKNPHTICSFKELTHGPEEISDTLYNTANPEQLTPQDDKTKEKSANGRDGTGSLFCKFLTE